MKEACLNMLQEYLLTRTFGHISQIWAASPLAASYSAKHRSSQHWPGDVATRTKSQTKQKLQRVPNIRVRLVCLGQKVNPHEKTVVAAQFLFVFNRVLFVSFKCGGGAHRGDENGQC